MWSVIIPCTLVPNISHESLVDDCNKSSMAIMQLSTLFVAMDATASSSSFGDAAVAHEAAVAVAQAEGSCDGEEPWLTFDSMS